MSLNTEQCGSGTAIDWDDIPHVRSFPASAMRLMNATKNPDCEAKEIVSIIECDPGYASQLLQIANSSLYGMSRRVGSIEQAVVVLGFRKLHDIAVSLAAADVFSQGNEFKKEREQLWKHSLAVAVTSRQLAKRIGLPADEAFLGGILHDVGKLVMLDVAAGDYVELACRFDRVHAYDEMTSIELEAFGKDHQEIGMDCADDWGLPFNVMSIIGHHHNPEESPDDPELSELTRFTNQLVDCWNVTGDLGAEADPVEEGVETSLSVSKTVIDTVRDEVTELYEEMQSVCGLP